MLNYSRQFSQILLSIGFICLSLLLYGISKSLATGYEISIYSNLPLSLWALLLGSLFCGICVATYSLSLGEQKYFFGRIGVLLVVLTNCVLLLLPLFRGYALYGRWDALTHVGYIVDIIKYGYISNGNVYPVVHVYLASFKHVCNISIANLIMYLPALLLIFYVLFTYILSKQTLYNQKAQLFSVLAATVLLISYNNYQVLPTVSSLYFIPLLFYLYFKRLTSKRVETPLLPAIIYQKLYEKGYCLIHTAGVSDGDCCYVFPGRGGMFKTSLVMDFIKHKNFKYVGDDRVILNDVNVLSYPANIVLFDYVSPHKENKFMSSLDKFEFIFSLWLHSRNSDYYKISTPITNQGKVNAVFFGSKVNGIDCVYANKIDKEDAIKKIIASNKLEICSVSKSHYYRYMQAYSYIFTENNIANYWVNLKASFEKIIENIPLYEIQWPATYSYNTFNQVFSLQRLFR